jgi:GNAT superfamily N-acetyltransferase
MEYNTERLSPRLEEELTALFEAYYAVTPAHTDLPPYDLDWPLYNALQDAGVLFITTTRDNEDGYKLYGAGLYMIVQHPHHRTMTVAECDILAVSHTRRGEGIGSTLLDFSINALRDRGVQRVAHRYRTCYNTTPLFEKHDFKLQEHVYARDIN